MLVNIISWIIIFFILYTWGDMLQALFNKIGKQEERYNPISKTLLGLCFLVVPLSIWSLWLPSNHLFLSIATLVCTLYWAINYKKTHKSLLKLNEFRNSFCPSQSIILVLFLLASLYFFAWQQNVYDSAFYHFQNIRWNEEYAVVPGVANIDDRFGFNSNFFLLSGIFTFRWILGEAIYPLQPVIVTLIGGWVICELFRSKYEIKRLIIFGSYLLLFWVSIYFLGNTSTDILPNFIGFYLIANIVLYPDLLKKNRLIAILLPIFLVTCKLSFFPIGIISLYSLYHLAKERKNSAIGLLCIISLFILIPWLIRNVIISGYLVYPLHQIDLFNFDWKVPKEIAIKETEYIFGIGYYFLRIALRYPHQSVRDPLTINILTDIIYLLVFTSFIIVGYMIWKKRKEIGKHMYLLYTVFTATILVWASGGPDIRFVAGILCAIIFTGGTLLLTKKEKSYPLLGKTTTLLFIIGIVIWTSTRFYTSYTEGADKNIISHLFTKPYSTKSQWKAKGIDIEKGFEAYPLNNNQTIWVSSELPFDAPLPASIDNHYSKFLPLHCLEARSDKVKDGYRAKEGCR